MSLLIPPHHRDCCKGHGNHDVGRKRNLEEHPNLPVGFRLDPKTNRTFELGRINPIESAGFRLDTNVTVDILTAFRFGNFDSFLCSYESLCVIRASGELGKSKFTFHRDNYTSWSGINRNPMKNVIDPHNINANEIPNNKDANPAGVICDGVSSGDVLHLILRVSDLPVITGEEI
ncbi:hypothetical protein L1887_31421 [Cichorium endivia]|nr:hypothetical protein L1887_31421 [Cichorium endivia]